MSKKTQVNVSIDSDLKKKVENILEELGMTPSQAIRIFYKQVVLQKGLPFVVRMPNQDSINAYAESRIRENLKSYNSPEELFDDLGI